MKAVLMVVTFAALMMVIIFALLEPESGVIYQAPLTPVAVGLIGLGLCRQALGGPNAGSGRRGGVE